MSNHPASSDVHKTKPAFNPTPDELRAKERARRAQSDIRYDSAEKRMYTRWAVTAALSSAIAALVNYLAFRPAIILHVIFTIIAVATLVRLKRGPLTGLILLGLGNEFISALIGVFSLIGFFSFMSAGGLLGMAIYIHRQP